MSEWQQLTEFMDAACTLPAWMDSLKVQQEKENACLHHQHIPHDIDLDFLRVRSDESITQTLLLHANNSSARGTTENRYVCLKWKKQAPQHRGRSNHIVSTSREDGSICMLTTATTSIFSMKFLTSHLPCQNHLQMSQDVKTSFGVYPCEIDEETPKECTV